MHHNHALVGQMDRLLVSTARRGFSRTTVLWSGRFNTAGPRAVGLHNGGRNDFYVPGAARRSPFRWPTATRSPWTLSPPASAERGYFDAAKNTGDDCFTLLFSMVLGNDVLHVVFLEGLADANAAAAAAAGPPRTVDPDGWYRMDWTMAEAAAARVNVREAVLAEGAATGMFRVVLSSNCVGFLGGGLATRALLVENAVLDLFFLPYAFATTDSNHFIFSPVLAPTNRGTSYRGARRGGLPDERKMIRFSFSIIQLFLRHPDNRQACFYLPAGGMDMNSYHLLAWVCLIQEERQNFRL
ncbi:unnamed protein product [Phaeothamnion confervicola]